MSDQKGTACFLIILLVTCSAEVQTSFIVGFKERNGIVIYIFTKVRKMGLFIYSVDVMANN